MGTNRGDEMLVSKDQRTFVYLGKPYTGDRPDISIHGNTYSTKSGAVAIRANNSDTNYSINDISVKGHRVGINLSSSSDVFLFDYEFDNTLSSTIYASAIYRDKDHTGSFYGQRIYANGHDVPLNEVSGGYSTTNTDFMTNDVHSKLPGAKLPLYFRDITAENFSDAIFDAKSTIYIMNATIENAYRLLRVWEGATVIIVNSELSTENGKSFAWLGKTSGKVFYHNSRFNGSSTPDDSRVEIDGVWAKNAGGYIDKQFVELEYNPLPAIDKFFSTSRSVYSVEISVDGGRWQKMSIPNGGRMDTFIGDPLFELPNLGRGKYDVRVFETTTSGVKRLLSEDSVTVGSSSTTTGGGSVSNAGFRLSVFDADSDRFLFDLRDGVAVDLATVQGRNLTLVADYASPNSTSFNTRSVRLDFDDGAIVRIEATAPYALFGDRGDDFFGGLRLGLGTFSFSAVAYNSDNGKGTALTQISGDFTVRGSSARVASATASAEQTASVGTVDPDLAVYAIDTSNGQRILEIGDDARFSRSAFGSGAVALVVEAKSEGVLAGGFGSMQLDYENGEILLVDNAGPFSAFGETLQGDLAGRKLDRGYYDLDVSVYAGADASGRVLKTYALDFELF